MSLATLKEKVEQLIEKAKNADDFIGVKYSNFSGLTYNLPKTADARSLDKILQEPSEVITIVNSAVNGRILEFKFANLNTNNNGGYFAQLEEVYLPTKASAFTQTFQNCTKLKTIHGNLSNIQTAGTSSFERCDSLDINAVIARMLNLNTIGNYAFRNCKQITEVTLPSTITSIHGGAFSGCTNLLDIYVPWAEGAIANAPWGATNATIHYNSEV